MTLILVLALVSTACNRSAEPELTTTTTTVPAESPSTTMPPTPTTEVPPTTTAETTPPAGAPVKEIVDFEIQVATSADDGNVLWVTIPAEDYTDRDLENFVVTQFDEEDGLWELHVLDDAGAVAAARVAAADRTPEEQALVDTHYLISLTEGNVVTFHGPFESAGSFLIGS
ncbi:MAG: hypothetical protein ACFCVC_16530 [Acidimicrobiia bacterium]